LTANSVMEDPRTQGWTVVCKTEFANLDDMKYYDEEDAAHIALKEGAKGLGIQGGPAGVLTAYYEDGVSL
jgi:hypothetical protein